MKKKKITQYLAKQGHTVLAKHLVNKVDKVFFPPKSRIDCTHFWSYKIP